MTTKPEKNVKEDYDAAAVSIFHITELNQMRTAIMTMFTHPVIVVYKGDEMKRIYDTMSGAVCALGGGIELLSDSVLIAYGKKSAVVTGNLD